MRWRELLLAAILVLPLGGAAAQGCAMCSTGVTASGARQQKALARGVLVLLAPPVVFAAGLVLLGRRWRGRTGE